MSLAASPLTSVIIRTLGDCHIVSGGHLVSPPLHFLRILVYVFLENAGGPVRRRSIGDLIWSDAGSEQANADIRQALTRIRRFQQESGLHLIGSDINMVWLTLGPHVSFDLADYMKLVNSPDPKSRVRMCELYTGDILASLRPAGEGFEEWLSFQRSAFRYGFINAISAAILPDSGLSVEDRYTCALKLLRIDPYHEGAQRALMSDAAGRGQLSYVRQLYEEFSHKLRNELGVGPDEETAQLYDKLVHRPPAA